MAEDYYTLIRQFGKDVSGAIQAEPNARLREAQTKLALADQQREQKFRETQISDLETKKSHREKAGAIFAQKGIKAFQDPTFMSEDYAAGGSAAQLAYIQKMSKEKDTRDRYEKQFDMATAVATLSNQKLGSTFSSVSDKMRKGEDVTNDMASATAEMDSFDQTMNTFIGAFNAIGDAGHQSVISKMKDQVYATMEPKLIEANSYTISKKLASMGGEVAKYSDKLDRGTVKFSSVFNSMGIPSTGDLHKYLLASVASKKIPLDVVKGLEQISDPKDLIKIIEDDGVPENTKIAALLYLKNTMAASAVQDRLKGIRSSEAESRRFHHGQTPEQAANEDRILNFFKSPPPSLSTPGISSRRGGLD